MIKVFVSLVAACLALAAQAQTQFPPFSPRPITIVLAFPPGASADGLMRLVTQKITDQTGQSFVIRNTPGGSGTVAAATVKRAPPDGLTLLQATLTTMATNQRLADEHGVAQLDHVVAQFRRLRLGGERDDECREPFPAGGQRCLAAHAAVQFGDGFQGVRGGEHRAMDAMGQ